MLDDKGVAIGATSRGKENWASLQRLRIDQIEEMLEETSVGGFVDRRCCNEHIRAFDGRKDAVEMRRHGLARHCHAEFWACIDDVEELSVAQAALCSFRKNSFDQEP